MQIIFEICAFSFQKLFSCLVNIEHVFTLNDFDNYLLHLREPPSGFVDKAILKCTKSRRK